MLFSRLEARKIQIPASLPFQAARYRRSLVHKPQMRPSLHGGCRVQAARYRRSLAHTAPQAMAPVPKNRPRGAKGGPSLGRDPRTACRRRRAKTGLKRPVSLAPPSGRQVCAPPQSGPCRPRPRPRRHARRSRVLWRVYRACREPPCPGAAWPAGPGLQGRAHRLAPRGAGGGAGHYYGSAAPRRFCEPTGGSGAL